MKQRIIAWALVCLLLAGCARTPEAPQAAEEPVERPAIAYVPLDDRPDNVERVVYLAESLGYTLEMPERDWYRTKLDGQPLNENGTQYGDLGRLYGWVLEQEAAGCDRYVLSMDQLLSGGLVNSRHAGSTLDAWSPAGVQSERRQMEQLLKTLSLDPNNRVWLLDSVMRLAPTTGYAGFGLEEYNALRAYGMEGRPVLTGEELTLSRIKADYRLGSGGQELDPADFGLEDSHVEDYLAARERKLELSDQMLRQLSQGQGAYEAFRVLIGIDDSSEEDSIQKNEIAYLRTLLREGDALLSGVDDLAFKAVTKLYLEESGWMGAAAAVRYFGGTEDRPACAYDYQPLTAIMEEHFAFFGLSAVSAPAQADLQVLVLTQPADQAEKDRYYSELIDDLETCRQQNWPVILIDAGNGAYGTAFHDALTEKTELGWLFSYAGFLDMAIVTGTALSHGVARYAYLAGGQVTDPANTAFAKTLADSILKDFCYKTIVREDILSYVRGELGGSADNFWQPEVDRGAIASRLDRGMEAAAADVVKNLERSNLLVSLDGTLAGWGEITLSNYRFPWDRAFEISMDLQIGSMTRPHKRLLGIYIR